MNLQSATDLNQALSVKDLKAKHVQGDNYLKILQLKKRLKDALINQSELEKGIFEGLEINAAGEADWSPETRKQVWEKLTPCRKDFKFDNPEPILNVDEFKEWTKEHDVAIVSILAEYLLKDFTPKEK